MIIYFLAILQTHFNSNFNNGLKMLNNIYFAANLLKMQYFITFKGEAKLFCLTFNMLNNLILLPILF